MRRWIAFFCTLLLVAAPRLSAQERGAAALGELVDGLGTTARVLMIGAHPDDEDTQLIAFLAKGRHIQTAYLALTRGDGGQNLIGNELGEQLGMIRTEELLAARRLDGGHQYFTRAFDFGFSKTLAETSNHWPKDSILKDAVAIVRAYRPQVIIAVFTGTPADGHGHHQLSGVIAREVFDAAADSVRFPASMFGGLQPWAPAKFYRLRRGFGPGGSTVAEGATLTFDVGEYDPLLGESYSEIATVSRSQHRSQGQGALPQYGPRFSGVRLEASRVSNPDAPETTLFDHVDTTWARFASLPLADSVRSAIDSLEAARAAVVRAEDLVHPSTMVAPLAAYVRLVSRAASGVTCTALPGVDRAGAPCRGAMGDLTLALRTTRERATDALIDAAAVRVDATAPRELVAANDTVPVDVTVVNRGSAPVELARASLTNGGAAATVDRVVPTDSTSSVRLTYHAGATPMRPWWLAHGRVGDMFNITGPGLPYPPPQMIEGEDRLQNTGAVATLRIAGVDVPVNTGPIVHRYSDPAIGEVRRPIDVVPAITVLLQHEIEYAPANTPLDRTLLVSVHSAATGPRAVAVSLTLPRGLTADSATRHLTLAPGGDASVYFRLTGKLAAGRHEISAVATSNGQRYTLGFVPIEYSHIRPQRYYRNATVAVEAVDAKYANLRIGYVRGVGDNIMPMLSELGLSVVELDPTTIAQADLPKLTTIVLGPRAYEANPELVANNAVLLDFARKGGTVVAQYGQAPYARLGVLPYPITLARTAERVTDEHAMVRVLDPGSPLLTTPNAIGESDFANWVQERATYMPSTFDPHYRAVLSMNDPGEKPNDAAILVAPVGKGTYIYTTLVFFRELPAGNPGAARLFINLLSANQQAANRPPVSSGAVRP
jgi:LmbE family N-acetylglucosaminyl deacetylase